MTDQPRWPRGTPVNPTGKGPGGGRFRDEDPVAVTADWARGVLGRFTNDWGRIDRGEMATAIDQKLEPLGPLTGGNVAQVQMHAVGRGEFVVHKSPT